MCIQGKATSSPQAFSLFLALREILLYDAAGPDPADQLRCQVRFMPILFVLFVGSGCAALIYEVVWLQLFQLVIGSSTVSLAVLLATFMGGMCLGSLLLPILVADRHHPLRVYALLELGIGVSGLAILFGMPSVEAAYIHYAGHSLSPIVMRGVFASACLLPPTVMMGATLPAIALGRAQPVRRVLVGHFLWRQYRRGCGWLPARWLLPSASSRYGRRDLRRRRPQCDGGRDRTRFVGATLSAQPNQRPALDSRDCAEPGRGVDRLSRNCFVRDVGPGCRGGVDSMLCSLGGTVYTFSLILSAFLIGLGIGSASAAILARRSASARAMLGVCQWLLTAAIAWSSVMLSQSLPYWPIDPQLSPIPWFIFQLDLLRCLWVILPPACLWGASFPLALASIAARGQDPGRLVGGVYAANTVGGIVGAPCVFSLLLIPTLGTAGAERVLIGLAASAALVLLVPLLRKRPF